MKQLFKVMFCILVLSLIIISSASAQESAMNTTWRGNYSNDTELVITFKSPATYLQQVTAIMYDKNVDNPTFNDYLRMAETLSVNGMETTFSVKLGNDLTASDGQYKLTLRGNGHLSSRSTETITVTILTPAKKDSALVSINGSNTSAALATELNKVKEALQMNLPADPDELERLMEELIKVRNSSDYNGNFAMLNDVTGAYRKAEVIVYLESDTVTADGLCEMVEKSADLFGFDKTNEDYIANKQSIYSKVISLKNTYKSTGIKTWQQLILAIEETTGVEFINNSEIEDIADAVAKYKSLVGISDSSYAAYLTLSVTGQEKVLRQVYASNFATIEQVKKAFEDGVKVELDAEDADDEYAPSKDKTTGVTIGGGGGGSNNDDVTPPPVEKNNVFSDLSNAHWAYTYVESLNKLGIISGYPEGTFKPENTVSREEFIKMIISAAGLYNSAAECDFSDVNQNDWFYSYIASAKQSGVISGVSEYIFGVGEPITREDVALIGARILDKLKDTNKATLKSATTSFIDNDSISEYAIPGVAALVDMGVINGFEDNTFKPKAFITRAQAAKIIYMIRAKI